jgi:biotin carboxyl carrier protein
VVQDERVYRLAQARGKLAADTGEVQIKSPMPGVIVKTPVGVGELVKMGQTVVILESMKMENELKATRDGVMLGVLVKPGQAVEKGEVLVVIGDASQGEA